jgi:hypothetical protein
MVENFILGYYTAMLDREEYIEQAYLYGTLAERIRQAMPSQEVLQSIKDEILVTTKLPMAIDYLSAELRHSGAFAPAMARLKHYFTPFQAYVIAEAEDERGRLDMVTGLEILRREAEYRAGGATPQGIFLYQFESLSRNRLRYDPGLLAVSQDPMFDTAWSEWILNVRRQIGLIDLADMIYGRSEQYWNEREKADAGTLAGSASEGDADHQPRPAILFGAKEGRIAWANRQKDPLLLFAALQRQLGYPTVPRPVAPDESRQVVSQLVRRMEKFEQRLKLVEEEQRGGIQIDRFYKPPQDNPES